MHWVFLILSNYLTFLQTLLFPFISGLFTVISLWISSAPITVIREGKREKKWETRNLKLSSHTVRALCPNSEMMREKRKERERKRYGQNWWKKKKFERIREWGILPFWEYGTLPRLITKAQKPSNIKGFRTSTTPFDNNLITPFEAPFILYPVWFAGYQNKQCVDWDWCNRIIRRWKPLTVDNAVKGFLSSLFVF